MAVRLVSEAALPVPAREDRDEDRPRGPIAAEQTAQNQADGDLQRQPEGDHEKGHVEARLLEAGARARVSAACDRVENGTARGHLL